MIYFGVCLPGGEDGLNSLVCRVRVDNVLCNNRYTGGMVHSVKCLKDIGIEVY